MTIVTSIKFLVYFLKLVYGIVRYFV